MNGKANPGNSFDLDQLMPNAVACEKFVKEGARYDTCQTDDFYVSTELGDDPCNINPSSARIENSIEGSNLVDARDGFCLTRIVDRGV